VGRRERNKAEKQSRLREAAKKLFREKGYEKTSIRQIAEEADLGLGTVYSYVSSKVALLDLISKDDLQRVQEDAFSSLPEGADLLEKICHVFGKIYAHHASDRELARILVKELGMGGDAAALERAERFQIFTMQLAMLLREAQDAGELGVHFAPELASLTIFGQHYFYLLLYLSGTMELEQITELFRTSVDLLIQGMRPGGG